MPRFRKRFVRASVPVVRPSRGAGNLKHLVFGIMSTFRISGFVIQKIQKKWISILYLLKYRRNSDKFSSKAEQNHRKEFKKTSVCTILPKNAKKFDENFLKYWGLSGAKACTSCRSRQELSNEYFLAKFGVDTEENEPYKVWSFGWELRIRFDTEPVN